MKKRWIMNNWSKIEIAKNKRKHQTMKNRWEKTKIDITITYSIENSSKLFKNKYQIGRKKKPKDQLFLYKLFQTHRSKPITNQIKLLKIKDSIPNILIH